MDEVDMEFGMELISELLQTRQTTKGRTFLIANMDHLSSQKWTVFDNIHKWSPGPSRSLAWQSHFFLTIPCKYTILSEPNCCTSSSDISFNQPQLHTQIQRSATSKIIAYDTLFNSFLDLMQLPDHISHSGTQNTPTCLSLKANLKL